MAPTNDTSCSGAGNPLTTFSKLSVKDNSTQQDKLAEKTSNDGERFRSEPRVSAPEGDKMFDDFLNASKPRFDEPPIIDMGGGNPTALKHREPTVDYQAVFSQQLAFHQQVHQIEELRAQMLRVQDYQAKSELNLHGHESGSERTLDMYGDCLSSPFQEETDPQLFEARWQAAYGNADQESLQKQRHQFNNEDAVQTINGNQATLETAWTSARLASSLARDVHLRPNCVPSQALQRDAIQASQDFGETWSSLARINSNIAKVQVIQDCPAWSQTTETNHDEHDEEITQEPGDAILEFPSRLDTASQPDILAVEDTPEVIRNHMLYFIAYGKLPDDHSSAQNFRDGVLTHPEKLCMHYWQYHLGLLEGASEYNVPGLAMTGLKALTQDDIFPGFDFLEISLETGRTLMGEMLRQLYTCLETTKRFHDIDSAVGDWVDVLWQIIPKQFPKMIQQLGEDTDASRQLREDVKELYKDFGSFTHHHLRVLEKIKQDYEEVVEDEDDIWILRLKPNALKLRSKL